MYSFEYLWNKLLKKLRGRAIINSYIDKTSKVEAGCSVVNVNIDRHSFCGYDCTLINCEIGAFCSIADNVSIGLASHPINWVSTSPAFIERKDSITMKYAKHPYEVSCKTTIGNDVWIGKGAMIKAGVKVGSGSIIGMGAVVTKDVPDYSIVAGIPAKVVRKRFSEERIEQLLMLKWWNWEDNKLFQYAPFFNNLDEFMRKVEEE